MRKINITILLLMLFIINSYAQEKVDSLFVTSVNVVDSLYDVGQYSSISFDEFTPFISYYDADIKRLKIAKRRGAGWAIEVVDREGDVGEYSSLAIDDNGRKNIVYYDATNRNLKYAGWIKPWKIEIVDNDGDVGQYNSMVFDGSKVD